MGLLTEMSSHELNTRGHKTGMTEALIEHAARLVDENTNFKLLGQSYDYSSYDSLVSKLESGDIKEQRKAALTFQMMDRTRTFIENMLDLHGESVVTANLGNLPKRVLDVVRIFYPNQISNEITDIQPIDGEVGTIFTMKPRFSESVAGVNAGDEVFKTVPTNFNYASEEVYESLGTGDGVVVAFSGTLSTLPVRPSTFRVSTLVGAAASIVVDDGAGNLVGANVASGSIDYTTGVYSITFSTAPDNGADLSASYCYSSEVNESAIRSVHFDIVEQPVKAKIHPLTFSHSVSSGLAAKAHLNIDVQDTLSQLAAQYIKIERDHKVINRVKNNAIADPILDFDATAGAGYQKNAKYGEIELKLDYAVSAIQTEQGRGGVDFVLCGTNAANVFSQVKGFQAVPVSAPIGPHVIGTMRDGTITVIKVTDTNVLSANDFIFGYKGYMAGDAAMILAEWIPVYFTPMFQGPRFKNEQGVMSMYDLFVNNAGYYRKGSISNYTA